MALYSLYCAEVPLRNCSLTHPYDRCRMFTVRLVFTGRRVRASMHCSICRFPIMSRSLESLKFQVRHMLRLVYSNTRTEAITSGTHGPPIAVQACRSEFTNQSQNNSSCSTMSSLYTTCHQASVYRLQEIADDRDRHWSIILHAWNPPNPPARRATQPKLN